MLVHCGRYIGAGGDQLQKNSELIYYRSWYTSSRCKDAGGDQLPKTPTTSKVFLDFLLGRQGKVD